jgi:hypothetical protein
MSAAGRLPASGSATPRPNTARPSCGRRSSQSAGKLLELAPDQANARKNLGGLQAWGAAPPGQARHPHRHRR